MVVCLLSAQRSPKRSLASGFVVNLQDEAFDASSIFQREELAIPPLKNYSTMPENNINVWDTIDTAIVTAKHKYHY